MGRRFISIIENSNEMRKVVNNKNVHTPAHGFISVAGNDIEANKVADNKSVYSPAHGFISVLVDSQGEKSGIGHFLQIREAMCNDAE